MCTEEPRHSRRGCDREALDLDISEYQITESVRLHALEPDLELQQDVLDSRQHVPHGPAVWQGRCKAVDPSHALAGRLPRLEPPNSLPDVGKEGIDAAGAPCREAKVHRARELEAAGQEQGERAIPALPGPFPALAGCAEPTWSAFRCHPFLVSMSFSLNMSTRRERDLNATTHMSGLQRGAGLSHSACGALLLHAKRPRPTHFPTTSSSGIWLMPSTNLSAARSRIPVTRRKPSWPTRTGARQEPGVSTRPWVG